MRILNAFRVFFGTLFNRNTAQAVGELLSGTPRLVQSPAPSDIPKPVTPPPPPPTKKPTQNSAVTLVATLQREARLIDFLKEDLSAYSDEQVGAAVREIHRDTGKVLERIFALQPVVDLADNASLTLDAGFEASHYRLTGKVAGSAPYAGTLQHAGWKATRCAIAEYTGSAEGAMIVAPAEVEVG